MRLPELQRHFIRAVVSDDPAAYAALRDRLLPAGRLAPGQALDIYRENRLGACVKTLQEVYPAIATILGEPYFRQLARRYARESPPASADLNRYGAGMAGFLRRLPAERAELEAFPYLPDLAELEWGWHRAFYTPKEAPGDTVSGLDDIAAVPQARRPGIRFVLHGCLTALRSPYPVLQIWRLNRRGGDAAAVEALAAEQYLAVYRSDGLPVVEEMEAADFELIGRIQRRAVLGELAESGCAERIASLAAKGWITGFKAPADTDEV